jgi:hypothetical protein
MAVPKVETEIRDWIVRYLAHEVSLEDFESWLVPATWDVDARKEPGAADLAYATQLLLAERARGHVDDSMLNDRLKAENPIRLLKNLLAEDRCSEVRPAGLGERHRSLDSQRSADGNSVRSPWNGRNGH